MNSHKGITIAYQFVLVVAVCFIEVHRLSFVRHFSSAKTQPSSICKSLMKLTQLVLLVLVVGCTQQFIFTPAPQNPDMEVSDGVNQLALDLHPLICENGANCVYSPYSIYNALGLALAGALDTTADQIQEVVGLGSVGDVNAVYQGLIDSVSSTSDGLELLSANRFYGDLTAPFLESYVATLQEYYSANALNLDFKGDAEGARQEINAWVEEVTKQFIKDLLPQGSVGASTIAVLVNALYFKGTWAVEFNKQDTTKENFKTGSGEIKQVDMMAQFETNYVVGDLMDLKSSFVKLPYKGNEASMYIVVPKPLERQQTATNVVRSDLATLLQSFNSGHLATMMQTGQDIEVDLFIPKFTAEFETTLSGPLISLGMQDAFDPLNANFGGMVDLSQTNNVYISEGFHKTKVVVDETGTEAAAATGLVLVELSLNLDYVRFRADEPFMFFIVHEPSKAVLFSGIINDPTLG
eukprot:TRINITY_DN10904_c0_g2_i1.p1 TRINITY_DN10904_c0_g2~~TRINITY_DN10904_c0_g2_i1.p1  ORF type:complete len:466 (+),score=66.66 TRINITY_DN10904_c0_g2_i1:61-1458(+)